MRAASGAGWALLFAIVFCVEVSAADPGLTGVTPAAAATLAKTPPDVRTKARSRYDEGRAAATEGKWQVAYDAQREAYALFAHPQIAGALGDAAFALGKYPEAIDMLSRHLRESTDLDPEKREGAEKRLADAKAKCGTLSVDAPAGAELRIDGAPAESLPLQRVLYLLPGIHTIELTAPSGGVLDKPKQDVRIVAGKDQQVQVHLVPPAPPPTVHPSSTLFPNPPVSAAKPSPVPVVVLGATAGLGAIVGGVLLGVSEMKKNEAEHADPDTAKQNALWGERDNLGNAGAWLLIGSGIVGLAAGTTALVQHRKQKTTATTWAPVVSTNGAGIVLSGSF